MPWIRVFPAESVVGLGDEQWGEFGRIVVVHGIYVFWKRAVLSIFVTPGKTLEAQLVVLAGITTGRVEGIRALKQGGCGQGEALYVNHDGMAMDL